MPTVKELTNNTISSGPNTSVKAGSVNLKTKAAKLKAAAEAASKSKITPDKGCKYKALGSSNFNIGSISFGGPYYVTSDPDELEILDNCVKRKLLKVVEDKRGK